MTHSYVQLQANNLKNFTHGMENASAFEVNGKICFHYCNVKLPLQ